MQKMTPELFAKEVGSALPGRIASLILFGSATTGDFVEGTSGYDLVLVVDRLGPAELRALGPAIRHWEREGNPLPLLFAPEQFAASSDAFALEFLAMKQSRQILAGEDLVAAIQVDRAHVRIHLERELMGKQLALGNRYALAEGDRRREGALLMDSASTFLSLFRTVLWLYQPEDVPLRKEDALRALTQHIPFDPQPFLTVLSMKSGPAARLHIELGPLFEQYWQAIETVVAAVDRLLHSGSQGD